MQRHGESINLNPEETNNTNAEWAILKEMADEKAFDRIGIFESISDPEQRRVLQERGQKFLRVFSRMEDRPDKETKRSTLERMNRLAQNIGIQGELQNKYDERIQAMNGVSIGVELFQDNPDLSPEEQVNFEKLRERVIDLTEVEPGALSERFPSGNFLYHGSTVERLEKILQTGGIKNGVALLEDDPNINAFDLNSGFEGVSWSLDAIDALPGTRGHIAGFLAAPEDILASDEQLVIPSRPAPYEVLQVKGEIGAEELYQLKNQYETWGDGSASLGEKNSVHGNLMRMLMYQEGHRFFGDSKVYQYGGDTLAEEMRKYFKFDEEQNVVWDVDIYQKSEIPPALPWFQSLLDRGSLQRAGYEGLEKVEDVIELAKHDKDFLRRLVATVSYTRKPIEEAYEQAVERARAIRISPEEMYFVTSHQDLESWLKVMARTGAMPKGILLYDDNQVKIENFASKYSGNHEELGAEIGRAIGVDDEFWQRELGMDPANMPRSGNVGQVLLESKIKRDKSLRLVDGKLTVETSE